MKKTIITLLFLMVMSVIHAQISGIVYRDYNGNGSRQTAAPTSEPGVQGITVNAYNTAGSLINSALTDGDGFYTMSYTVPVRVEFLIPAGACVSKNLDFTGFSGDGNSVRFVNAATNTLDYAISQPDDYIKTTNPYVFVPTYQPGNPLGGGNSGTLPGFKGYLYNSITTPASEIGIPNSIIGTVWGVAYSKQAKRVFTSAFIKRHAGLGPLGSGGIYMLEPTANSFNVTQFYNMDAHGHRTRAGAGAVAYGSGSSYTITGNSTITFNGAIDPVSGYPQGLGVVGSNLQRGLPADITTANFDPAAFDQVGKVGLGDIEISDDGRFLFVMNLYSRRVFRLELNDAYNPTSVISVTSYALPGVAVNNGVLRPFALSYHRDKLYVGAVSSGENGGVNNMNGGTDLYVYVFEMTNPSGTAIFNTIPVMNFPLNYLKGSPYPGANTEARIWNPWTNNSLNTLLSGVGQYNNTGSSAVLSDIEFTDRGDMVLNFFDRAGHQYGGNNYLYLDVNTSITTFGASGEILIAGKSCATGQFVLENNASYNSNGTAFVSAGMNNTEGPGNGEFFYRDNWTPGNAHNESSFGSTAALRGSKEIILTFSDPLVGWSGGSVHFNAENAERSNDVALYNNDLQNIGFGKGNGLGDIEIAGDEPPIEIGNRVWNDVNRNGIQDASEPGIANVSMEIFSDFNNDGIPDGPVLGNVVTNAEGEWYFNESNITDGDPSAAGNQAGLRPNKNYIIRPGIASWTGGVGIGALTGFSLTKKDIIGNGQPDLSDNDAAIVNGMPQISVTTGAFGQNDHSVDFGLSATARLGDYVWNDIDKDGIQDANEVGVAGVTVTLYDSSGHMVGTTITDAYGHYEFTDLTPGDYSVGFTLPANYIYTGANAGGNSNTDSDVNPATGATDTFTLIAGENNTSVDAGIYFQQPLTSSIGDYVWLDVNKDGIQDATEVGISGITVTLYNSNGDVVAVTKTNADGHYIFTDVPPGNYTIGFSTPPGLIFSPANGTVNGTNNSDASPIDGMTQIFTVTPGENITYVDAGMYPQSPLLGGIGDRVWNDLNQNGIQDAGEPGVSGVTVTLYSGDGVNIISSTTTNGFGYYNFGELNAGQYIIGFSSLPAGYILSQINAGIDSTLNSDANINTGLTTIINLSEGQYNMTYDAGIHNTNPANNNSIGDYVWNDLDKNGIQDAGERGVPGITVTLYDINDNVVDLTFTDENGYYIFPDLPDGAYHIGFTNLPEGYVFSKQGQGTSGTNSDTDPSTGITATVTVTGGQHINDIDAGINAGNLNTGKGSIGDKVWYDLNGNGLQDVGEAGVAEIAVTLYGLDGLTVIATTTTDALGNYIFNNLDEGGYVVGFANLPVGFTLSPKDADGMGISGAMNSDVNTVTQKTDIITLGKGEDKMTIDMGIIPPAGTASLGDKVWFDLNNDGLQTAGEPGVQGVTVTLYNVAGNMIGITTTDINGEYHFAGLTPGAYIMQFNNLPSGYNLTGYNVNNQGVNGATNSDADPITGLTQLVSLSAGDNNLNIDAGIVSATVAGVGDYVWNDINRDGEQDANEPGIGGILVTLYENGNPVASTITKPDGSYIFTNVIPGTYTMGFDNLPEGMIFTAQEGNQASNTGSNVNSATGFTPTFIVTAGTYNPTVDAGLTTPLLAGLGNYVWHDKNENSMQGAGEPGIAAVLVTLYAADNVTPIAAAVTDGNGAYTFTNLPADTYVVGFSNLPEGSIRAQVIGILDEPLNSDMKVSGKTDPITLLPGIYNANIDAGIFFGLPLSARELTATIAILESQNQCNVNWFTSSELNTKNFDIERSTDGKNFSKTGDKLAGVNTIDKTNYNFIDDITDINHAELIYYRIRLNDIDGYFKYSNVITARPVNNDNILVYPTIFNNSLSIEYTSASEDNSSLAISIIDVAGRTIATQNFDIVKGFNKLCMNNLEVLAFGNYYLRIINQDIDEKYIIRLQKK